MNLEFYAPALSLAVPCLLGLLVLRALGLRFATDRLAWPAWVWLTGSLLTAAIELAVLVAGAGTERWVHDLAALALALGLFLAGRHRPPQPAAPRRPFTGEQLLFLALVALALVYVLNQLLLATLEPIYFDDEAHFWAERAKLLYTAGGFGPEYQAGLRTLDHSEYPLLNPLLQVWVFVHAGEILHVLNRLPMQLAVPAVVLLLASGARRTLRAPAAGLLVLTFVGSMLIVLVVRRAHSDILVAFGGLVLLDAYLRWREERHDAWIVLAALGAAYLAWAKNEGQLVLAALALVAALERWRSARAGLRFELRLVHLAWLVPASAVGVTWLHNRVFELHSKLVGPGAASGGLVARLLDQWQANTSEVLGFFAETAVNGSDFQLLPLALLLLVLADLGTARRLRAPLLVLALVLAGFALVLIATPAEVTWHLKTAGKRLALQVYPALTLLVAALMGRWLPAEPTHAPDERLAPPRES